MTVPLWGTLQLSGSLPLASNTCVVKCFGVSSAVVWNLGAFAAQNDLHFVVSFGGRWVWTRLTSALAVVEDQVSVVGRTWSNRDKRR